MSNSGDIEKVDLIRACLAKLKNFMDAAHDLSNGGRNINALLQSYSSNRDDLLNFLSRDNVQNFLNDALSKEDLTKLPRIGQLGETETRELLHREYVACASYNLERFVMLRQVVRVVAYINQSSSEPGPVVKSAADLHRLIADGSEEYLAKMFRARRVGDIQTENRRRSVSPRREKNAIKQSARGLYNLVAACALLFCNTTTLQMQSSAALADGYIKSGRSDLFDE